MKKYSIIVGIPAHNEEQSIQNTITTLLKQTRNNFVFKKIVVFSDNSSDKTNSIIQQQNNKLVKLIISKQRVGKTNGIKNLLKTAKDESVDFLIIIDADLRINTTSVLDKLVKKISSSNDIAAVSGNVIPLNPKNLIQRLGYFGFWLHQKTIKKLGENKLYFYSSDPLIILRVNEFDPKKIKNFSYMHDEFYYLFCKKYGKQFDYEDNAKVYFVQPNNFKDYVNQTTRYISKHFSSEEITLLTNNTMHISFVQKVSTYTSFIKSDFLTGILYLLIQLYCHILFQLKATKFNNTWVQIKSTK